MTKSSTFFGQLVLWVIFCSDETFGVQNRNASFLLIYLEFQRDYFRHMKSRLKEMPAWYDRFENYRDRWYKYREMSTMLLMIVKGMLHFLMSSHHKTMKLQKKHFSLKYTKVWIIKIEAVSKTENGITSIIFDQSIWNFVKITISRVLYVAEKSTWLDENSGC